MAHPDKEAWEALERTLSPDELWQMHENPSYSDHIKSEVLKRILNGAKTKRDGTQVHKILKVTEGKKPFRSIHSDALRAIIGLTSILREDMA